MADICQHSPVPFISGEIGCGAIGTPTRSLVVRPLAPANPDEEVDLEDTLVLARPKLVRALIGARGVRGAEGAAAEAITWALEHPERARNLEQPVAYLYRVALTRTAAKKRPDLPPVEPQRLPEVEPALIPALLELPERQRVVVWLVHACDWRYAEVATALGISKSAVGTHSSRALESLRSSLGVDSGGLRP